MMMYKPIKPRYLGVSLLKNIEVKQLINYIDWKFFFRTWRLIGDYSCLITNENINREQWLSKFTISEHERAKQIFDLWKDTQQLLKDFIDKKQIQINALVGMFDAFSDRESIVVKKNNEEILLPMFRQQCANEDGFCLSLADFIAGSDDYIGVFAVAVHLEKDVGDEYCSLLQTSLRDRLVEAATEWLHEQIRKYYWGFALNESLSFEEMKQSHFQGIRPAVGYPSLPDQSIIFEVEKLLPLQEVGISLTENGAMNPSSSICGFVFAHPQSRYFRIGQVSRSQFIEYANRRGISCERLEKFIGLEIV